MRLCLVSARADLMDNISLAVSELHSELGAHRAPDISHPASGSLNLFLKSGTTGNCCQGRRLGTTIGRFGRSRRGLCSQAVIQRDKAERWKGKAEGNRSNGVLTNE